MKQKVGMVLCVLLGAALVMMCDSDAVQDMMDGEEAAAATTSELASITCPDGAVLVESAQSDKKQPVYQAGCWDVTTKTAHGPAIARLGNGVEALRYEYAQGKRHGLQLTWDENTGALYRAECYDLGTVVWKCNASGEWDGEGAGPVTFYQCSTREEAEALAAEHGCP